tara:strand:- start:3599 stop:3796 length:198 start_codon:yes stop_codon:yes gene_type:complete
MLDFINGFYENNGFILFVGFINGLWIGWLVSFFIYKKIDKEFQSIFKTYKNQEDQISRLNERLRK